MHASRDMLLFEEVDSGDEIQVVEYREYTAYFARVPAGTDFTSYYDSAECPHFGYVFSGRLRFVSTDGRHEVVSAGDLYFIPPGHVFYVLEDAETVEFSPTAPHRLDRKKIARTIAEIESRRDEF
jgi:mannose-6-phosphate isomerase-like protein (cupin superfamily)